MNKFKKFIYAIVAVIAISCASFQSTSGKFLASTAQTVDVAMKGYSLMVIQQNIPPEQQAGVRQAYLIYQKAMLTASNAWSLNDQTAFGTASNLLVSARNNVLTAAQTVQIQH